jgi:hypothetical protein
MAVANLLYILKHQALRFLMGDGLVHQVQILVPPNDLRPQEIIIRLAGQKFEKS